jgi:microcystin-dependent protein
MAEPFLSEIRWVSFNFAPKGWAMCNGQLLPINQNQALFSLLGTTYGGDGRVNFALPDMRSRVPIHEGSGHTLGERGGEAAHTITISEMATHVHLLTASTSTGNSVNPNFAGTGRLFASSPGNVYTKNLAQVTTVHPSSVSNVGGSQAHENRQPYLVLNAIIALQGIFPSQN